MFSQNPNPSPTPSGPGGFQLNGRTILIIGVIVLAAIFLLPRLLGGNNQQTTNPDDTGVINPPTSAPSQPISGSNTIGEFVAATGVDRDNCPTGSATSYSRNDVIYVGVVNGSIPADTDIFVRLYRDGEPVEDTDLITADQEYPCVSFIFEPTEGAEVFETGNYEAQIFVNGNPGDSVSFTVR